MKTENKYSAIALKNMSIILDIRKIPIGTIEKELGVSIGHFSRLKKKEASPSFEVMVRVCKYLNVNIDDLIKDDFLSDIMSEIQEYQNKIKDCENKIKERIGGRRS